MASHLAGTARARDQVGASAAAAGHGWYLAGPLVEVLARSPVDVATLLFGEAAPYSVEFLELLGIRAAFLNDVAACAYGFRSLLAFVFDAPMFAFWGVEQRGILLAASRSELPVP